MADYRDPKVTSTKDKRGGAGRWIGIAAAVVIVLLLLAWLLGWFGGEVETVEPAAVEEPAAAEETVTVEEEPAATEEAAGETEAVGEETETIEVEGEAEVVE